MGVTDTTLVATATSHHLRAWEPLPGSGCGGTLQMTELQNVAYMAHIGKLGNKTMQFYEMKFWCKF